MTRKEIEAMDRAAVNAFLAEKVMGWELHEATRTYFPSLTRFVDWDPYNHLDHVMEAAEKVAKMLGLVLIRIEINVRAAETAARINPKLLWELAPTPALAVCRAVIAAHEAQVFLDALKD